MRFDLSNTVDSIKDGIEETTELAHEKTNKFHEKYVSKVTPDFGKYGDAAKFVAEMAPGVSEYNAIKDGDWQAFAIAAGIDITAVTVAAFTAGAGYAAVKGSSTMAKTGVKVAAKEIAEAGTKKVVKEVAETGTKKVVKETVEAGVENVAKETVEAGTEKLVKETVEEGAEKATKEIAETGTEKVVKENVEKGTIIENMKEGKRREKEVLEKLTSKYGDKNLIEQAYLRDANGIPIRDAVTGEARRVDFIVKKRDKIMKSIEVTSETAPKKLQTEKELRIINQARKNGGVFIKDPETKKLLEFTEDIVTELWRLK